MGDQAGKVQDHLKGVWYTVVIGRPVSPYGSQVKRPRFSQRSLRLGSLSWLRSTARLYHAHAPHTALESNCLVVSLSLALRISPNFSLHLLELLQ